jgi:hypothetical protein
VHRLDKQLRVVSNAQFMSLLVARKSTPIRNRITSFCRWFSTDSGEIMRMKLMSSTALNWMSYAAHGGSERITQVQTAWFDYRRTIKIKLDAFILQKRRNLLKHWFLLKCRKDKKKVLRRVLQWAVKRV